MKRVGLGFPELPVKLNSVITRMGQCGRRVRMCIIPVKRRI